MTKYLFVLTSSPKDFFCEQTLVAIASLRDHNPKAFVSLLTDDRTAETLTGKRAVLKEAVDELKVLSLDEKLSPMQRSRYLKTVMRNEIDGDFLYMDSDIAVVGSLDIPEKWRGGIYAVLDFHTNLHKAINRKKVLNAARMLGFSPILNDELFNGGVMFASDTPDVRAFLKSGTSFGSIRFRKTIPTTWRLLPKRIFPLATRFGKCPVSGIASSLTASDSCRTRKFSISSVRGLSTLAAAGFRIRWTPSCQRFCERIFIRT